MQQIIEFPFLSSARKLLEGEQSKIGYEEIQRAIARAVDSMKIGLGKAQPAERVVLALAPKQAAEVFATARLLVCILDSEYYLNAFAKGEALSAKTILENKNVDETAELLLDFFPTAKKTETGFEVSLFDYLSCGDSLSLRNLRKGIVLLSQREALFLFEKAVYSKLRKPLPTAGVPALFKEAIPELRERLPAQLFKADFSGKYLSLPCIQWILEGVPEGKRYYASMALAVACREDGLPREEAVKIMQQFVENSGKSAHPFTIREGTATIDWVYRRTPRFSCKYHREHGLGPEGPGYPCQEVIKKSFSRRKPP